MVRRTAADDLRFGIGPTLWTKAAKGKNGVPLCMGVVKGAARFMAGWHKDEREASRKRAGKRDKRRNQRNRRENQGGVGGGGISGNQTSKIQNDVITATEERKRKR